MTKMKRCQYLTEKDLGDIQGLKMVHCRKIGYYGINGKRYCYEHKRIMEIVHIESNRRYV